MLGNYDEDGDDCGVGDSGCGDNDHNDGESCYYYAARATTMQPHDCSLCAAAAAWRRVRSDRSDRIQIRKGAVLSRALHEQTLLHCFLQEFRCQALRTA